MFSPASLLHITPGFIFTQAFLEKTYHQLVGYAYMSFTWGKPLPIFKYGRRNNHECRRLEPVAILCRKSVLVTDFGKAVIHSAIVPPEGSSSLEPVVEN